MITLNEGDKAPAFSGKDQNGEKVSLAQYKGQKLILFFYPQASTPTCTVEACNLRDNFALLQKKGFAIIGVSPDGQEKQKKFEQKHSLPFPLLADTSQTILSKYGVWSKKKLFGHEYMGVVRTTFIINEKGIIQKIFKKPKSKMHAEEILTASNEV